MSQSDPRMNRVARRKTDRSTAAEDRLSIIVVLFLLGLVFPLMINLGPLRLTFYRIVLLLCVIPCLIRWISGRAGPIRLADVCVLLIGFWGCISWAVLHGIAKGIEPAGIQIVETWGAYFLARCFIRSPEAFYKMVSLLFWIIVGLLPFLTHEILTGRNLILEFIDMLGSTYELRSKEPRLGLERAQGPFQHPILLGVFCGSAVSLTYYVVAQARILVFRAMSLILVVFAAFCSLSSGPISGVAIQLIMITWDSVFRHYRRRWWGFGGLCALGYMTIDFISNRSPLVVLMSYLALNPATALGRLLVWEWGWKDIMKHPLFGNVLGDWERPAQLVTGSADMFWLARAMAHGLPMGLLNLLAFFSIFVAVARRDLFDLRCRDFRQGYLGGLMGIFIAGWAVYLWNETYVLLMFLMGSGGWLIDYKEMPPVPKASSQPARRRTIIG